MLVLSKQNPEMFEDQGIDFFITNIGEGTDIKAVEVARQLRSLGFSAQYDVDQKKLKAQFRKADRVGARYVVTLGVKELAEGKLTVKRLSDGQQFSLEFTDLEDKADLLSKIEK